MTLNAKTKKMKIIKRLFLIVFLGVLSIGLFTFWANDYMAKNAEGKIFHSVKDIPHRKVGLLLGTSKKLMNGYNNYYFVYRIKAAAELYHAKKLDYIIVSGDNSVKGYNETEDMKLDLIAKGVPENSIFEDFAGFRTLDSVVRAKEIFGQDSITIISQQFHNERAIFLAEKHDINAIAFNAKDVNAKWGFRTKIREVFARVKVFVDLLTGKEPKFGGEKILIP